jgi:hypothetical protein
LYANAGKAGTLAGPISGVANGDGPEFRITGLPCRLFEYTSQRLHVLELLKLAAFACKPSLIVKFPAPPPVHMSSSSLGSSLCTPTSAGDRRRVRTVSAALHAQRIEGEEGIVVDISIDRSCRRRCSDRPHPYDRHGNERAERSQRERGAMVGAHLKSSPRLPASSKRA